MAANRPVRVAIAGARGKTGSVVAAALSHAPGLEVIGRLVRPDSKLDGGEYSDFVELATAQKPDVLVDFTVYPDSKMLALQALSLGIRPVIGTSGYTAADVEELRETCTRLKIGAVYAPNFAIGAILTMQFAKAAAPYFTYADIVETHQIGKKDAPSGTALATARIIAQAGHVRRERSEIVRVEGARGAEVEGVGIHSIRIPGVIASQEVIFANDDETLVIHHTTSTRSAFVSGVIKAAHAAAHLDHFVEGLAEFGQ